MKLITLLITITFITGCYAKRIERLEQITDQNFQAQSGHIQNLLEKVFAENLAKGRALNCKNGFNYLTVKCLEDSK
jgi:hypothetical protein